MFKLKDGRQSAFQWDMNLKLIVEDPSITKVNFCNKTSDYSLVVEVIDGEVNIPNILLQECFDIHVYANCYLDDMEFAKVEEVIKVIERCKPDDYVYTETEIWSYEQLENRVDNLETGLDTKLNKPADNGGLVYINSSNEVSVKPIETDINGNIDNPISCGAVKEALSGNTYKLIDTITLTESTTVVDKAFDKPLKKLFIQGHVPNKDVDVSDKVVIYAVIDGLTAGLALMSQITNGVFSTADAYWGYLLDVSEGMLEQYVSNMQALNTARATYTRQISSTQASFTGKLKSIKQIRFSTTKQLFPVGTTITIYGMEA